MPQALSDKVLTTAVQVKPVEQDAEVLQPGAQGGLARRGPGAQGCLPRPGQGIDRPQLVKRPHELRRRKLTRDPLPRVMALKSPHDPKIRQELIDGVTKSWGH